MFFFKKISITTPKTFGWHFAFYAFGTRNSPKPPNGEFLAPIGEFPVPNPKMSLGGFDFCVCVRYIFLETKKNTHL